MPAPIQWKSLPTNAVSYVASNRFCIVVCLIDRNNNVAV